MRNYAPCGRVKMAGMKPLAFLAVLALVLAAPGALAQHDDHKGGKDQHGHDLGKGKNQVVAKHPLLFRHPVPPPNHHSGPHHKPHPKPHKRHKVWVVPHRDKHGHLIKGHWSWR